MKKTILISLPFFLLCAKAQVVPTKISLDQSRYPCAEGAEKKTNPIGKATLNAWYDITNGVILTAPNSTAFQSFVSFIMPDSNGVQIDQNGAKSHIGQHGTGFVFDPKDESLINNGNTLLTKWNYWDLDSIALRYLYVRNVDFIDADKVVDTLVVRFFKGASLVKGTFGTGNTAEVFARPIYLPKSDSVSGEAGQIRILLTGGANPFVQGSASDSTTTINENSWLTKFMTIPANLKSIGTNTGTTDNFAGFTVSFRPMLKPELGDTIISAVAQKPVKRFNYFGYRFQVNTGAGNEVRQKVYFSNMLSLPKDTRYGQTVNGWTGYIPGNAFVQPQYLDFQYFLSSNNIGINEGGKDGYAFGNVYPNPSSGDFINIDFTIPVKQKVNLEIFDLAGKKVKELSAEASEPGKHTLQADIADLLGGLYVYTLSGKGFSHSGKLSILK